ncbi:DUF975 family protein [Alloscardovia theropitheci]|uniref:DUF975 family protein n=1 Tax=Alloscardovia theropitheci TaxID=2496842 RepID=A0A4R0QY35_9BIFI|nr:DUF975 family protein [Alloscardovia theropitheci]TCD54461.1 DUF975 family protein [Alloscardovia theropitheci]
MNPINRAQLKAQTKASLQGKWGLAVGLLITLSIIPVILAAIQFSSIAAAAAARQLPTASPFIGILIAIAGIYTAITGIVAFLHIFDGTDQGYGKELTSAFTDGKTGANLVTYILQIVFTFLWSMLFWIPGIVASYSYSMSLYIVDDWAKQGYKAQGTEAITASKNMMKGHKGELFVLDLSFLGWYILSGFTFGLLNLYVTPYHMATRAAFYRALVAQSATPVAPVNPMAPTGAPYGAPQAGYGQPVQGYTPAQGYTQAPAQPVQAQAAPMQPNQPAQPYNAVPVYSQPVAPQPAQPVQPVQPTAPVQPEQSTENPAEPTDPTAQPPYQG